MTKATTPDPIDIHVGQRIRARRKMLRLSQTQLGNELGVTFQQVQKYEHGINRIGSSSLWRTAQALGVSVSCFFEGLGDKAGIEESREDKIKRLANELHAAVINGKDER